LAIFQPTITSGQDAQKQARETFLEIESNQSQKKQIEYIPYAKL
jgi:peptidase E